MQAVSFVPFEYLDNKYIYNLVAPSKYPRQQWADQLH